MAARRTAKAGKSTVPRVKTVQGRRWVTQSEYARHRKVSPERVRQWRVAGQLVTDGDGRALRIDVEASDRLLLETRDPQQDHARTDITRFGDEEEGDAGQPVEASRRYAEARARKEQANAKLAELKLEEERGRLVDRAAMTSAVYDLAKRHQTGLLNLPARVAANVAARLGCTDFEAQEVLEQVIRDHLREQGRMVLRLKSSVAVELDAEEDEDDAAAA